MSAYAMRLCPTLIQSKINARATTIAAAFAALEKLTAHPRHRFWEDDISLSDYRFIHRDRLQGYRQITDAYLLGLCMRHGGQFVTFDQGLSSLLAKTESQNTVILIPQDA